MLIPNDYEVQGFLLGEWLDRNRSNYKGTIKNRLTPEKIDLLNKIDMIWDVYMYHFVTDEFTKKGLKSRQNKLNKYLMEIINNMDQAKVLETKDLNNIENQLSLRLRYKQE